MALRQAGRLRLLGTAVGAVGRRSLQRGTERCRARCLHSPSVRRHRVRAGQQRGNVTGREGREDDLEGKELEKISRQGWGAAIREPLSSKGRSGSPSTLLPEVAGWPQLRGSGLLG